MTNSSKISWATPESLAAAFTDIREDVMSKWAERVISEISVAADLDRPVLIDSLPILYDDIAEALSPGMTRPFATSKTNLARVHGQERAKVTSYGPGDLVHELQLFREVVFAALKARGADLSGHECEIIGQSIEIA